MNIKPEQIPAEAVEIAANIFDSYNLIASDEVVFRAVLAAALPVLLGEPVGCVVDGFHDALGGSVHVAEWTGNEPPLGAILYTLPTQDTPNADQ